MCERTKQYEISGKNKENLFGNIIQDFKKNIEVSYGGAGACKDCGSTPCECGNENY